MYPFKHTLLLTAILGDLAHKSDLYLRFGTYGPTVECYFTNLHQAQFLRQHYPEAITHPGSSVHTLGTLFEYHYYSNLTFKLSYLNHHLTPCDV